MHRFCRVLHHALLGRLHAAKQVRISMERGRDCSINAPLQRPWQWDQQRWRPFQHSCHFIPRAQRLSSSKASLDDGLCKCLSNPLAVVGLCICQRVGSHLGSCSWICSKDAVPHDTMLAASETIGKCIKSCEKETCILLQCAAAGEPSKP